MKGVPSGTNQHKPDPNVIVAVIDALRSDCLTCKTAPWLSELAQNNVYFSQAFSPINATEPLLASFYTGKYPATTGVYNHGTHLTQSDIRTLDEETFLQTRFQSAGYETMAFDWLGNWHESGYDFYSGQLTETNEQTGNQKTNRIRPALQNLKQQILSATPPKAVAAARHIRFRLSKPTVEPNGWLPDSADIVTDAAFNQLTDSSSPSYAFLHFWDTHTPYKVPEKYIQPFGDASDPAARYRGAISFVDEQLKQFYNALESATNRPTVLLVMGDHGESLGEHGIYYDHHGLYDVSLHVPIILSHPNLPTRTVSQFVQHIDLAPTLAESILGESLIDTDGISLLPTIFEGNSTRDAIYAEEAHKQRKAAIRTDRYKYIETVGDSPVCAGCYIVHGGESELYDLERDPEEIENLMNNELEIADQLQLRLSNWRKSRQNDDTKCNNDGDRIEDPELEQRLSDLGYLQ